MRLIGLAVEVTKLRSARPHRVMLRENDFRQRVGRVNELIDGMVCSLNATTGAAIGPYRESRLKLMPILERRHP
jgi:hypothetical protein